jgi:hypothetical protein
MSSGNAMAAKPKNCDKPAATNNMSSPNNSMGH